MSRLLRILVGSLAILAGVLVTSPSRAQTIDQGWSDASTATAIAAAASSVLMPRVFYSNPEATVGWKARWHVSSLAPTMSAVSLAFLNESVLKPAFADPGPAGGFGLFSTETYVASASLGQGISVFLIDTLNNSGGKFHFGSLAGHVLLPLALTGFTAGGRIASNEESGAQVLGSVAVGAATGLVFGLLYSTMLEPNCGYTGDLICW
ncbi:MAG TPA: hypothetical protein VLC09_18075 [Polyangiaceae bacterium]|nr:hypothetical protein [Polyangiaceae bacterium]